MNADKKGARIHANTPTAKPAAGQKPGRLAAAYRAAGQLPQARQNLTAGRAIIADLVARFPDWAVWKQDLAWFDAQIAEVGR